MRIVFANRYFFPDQSATSRMISSLAFALQKSGFEVVVIASRDLHNQRDTVLPAKEIVGGVRVHRLPTTRFGRNTLPGRFIDYVAFHALAFLWLLRQAQAGDVAVICTDPPLLSVTSALALRLKRCLTVHWIMDLFPETALELGVFGRLAPIGQWSKALRNRSLGTAGVVVCPTHRMAEYLKSQHVPADHVTTIYHWSDGDEIQSVDRADNSLRAAWGLKDKFVVGYSGNFGRAHEFSTMLQAAKRLQHRDDIRFLLIGGGHQHGAVIQAAHALELDNIVFKPLQPVNLLSESLGAADVHLVSLLPQLEHCIIPSKFYGILAAGRATIFIGDTDGEVARALARSDCGVSLSIGDVDALTTVIGDMADDSTRCRQMGRAARQLLLAEHTRDKAVDTWSALLARLEPRPARAHSVVPETAS